VDVPEEERREAARAEELIRKKLLASMGLQADIDALMRDAHPTPFGSEKWKHAGPETLQRVVLMAAIQFILFEPGDWVAGNDEFKTLAEKMLPLLLAQLKTLKDISRG
jgi:hypothetical protein